MGEGQEAGVIGVKVGWRATPIEPALNKLLLRRQAYAQHPAKQLFSEGRGAYGKHGEGGQFRGHGKGKLGRNHLGLPAIVLLNLDVVDQGIGRRGGRVILGRGDLGQALLQLRLLLLGAGGGSGAEPELGSAGLLRGGAPGDGGGGGSGDGARVPGRVVGQLLAARMRPHAPPRLLISIDGVDGGDELESRDTHGGRWLAFSLSSGITESHARTCAGI
jgi:hypothetical protein